MTTPAPTPVSPVFRLAFPTRGTLNGVLFVALFAAAITHIAALPALAHLGMSPLIVGIVAGALYGNALRGAMPDSWNAGVNFSARALLRIAVAFFGLRISFQEIAQMGLPGLAESALVVLSTLSVGAWVGTKLLKLDRDTALLIAAGSAVCGAAAVLAFESALRSKPYKSAIALSSVMLFGTLSMFLYPAAYRAGWLPLDTAGVGLFFGGTIHEVAQVVGAASSVSMNAVHAATIVKMTRVMLLVPVLLVVGFWPRAPRATRALARDVRPGIDSRIDSGIDPDIRPDSHPDERTGQGNANTARNARGKIAMPWFALGFAGMVGVNSLHVLPIRAVDLLDTLDTFALTMAMTALGIETRIAQIRQAGPRALLAGAILYLWLIGGGLGITWFVLHFI